MNLPILCIVAYLNASGGIVGVASGATPSVSACVTLAAAHIADDLKSHPELKGARPHVYALDTRRPAKDKEPTPDAEPSNPARQLPPGSVQL